MKLRPYSEYKDSGVSWLGGIPAHWPEKRAKYYFKEIDQRSQMGDEEMLSVSHITGVTPRSQKNVTMFKAESNVGQKRCQPGDLVINTLWAWMSALGVSNHAGIVSPAYGVYRPRSNHDYDNYYLDHLLRTEGYRSEYICRSTGIRSSRLRLYPDKFLSMPVVCPPLVEQQTIARFLKAQDRLFRKFIRNKRRLIELLTEQKQNVINQAVTRGIDPGVGLKPSGVEWIGDIPEHWEVARLRNVTKSVTSGSRSWSLYAADDGPLFIRVANLSRMSLDLRFNDVVRLKLPETSEVLRTRLRSGDILLSITAYIGSIAVVPEQFEEAYVSQHVARCSLNSESHNPRWLGYVLLSEVGQTHGKLSLYGGTKDGLSLDDVKNYPLLLPPRCEQDEIVAAIEQNVGNIEQAIIRAQHEIDLIREYRTRLISDVVTGQVDARGIEVPHVAEEELSAMDEDAGESGDPIDDEADMEDDA